MRYLWNKKSLLSKIENIIKEKKINWKVFCDAFSWTWTLWDYFKKDYNVISNDVMYFSYVLSYAKTNYIDKKFDKLWFSPFEYFNNSTFNHKWFIYNNYCPELSWRMYFSNENGILIDSIRLEIEQWYNNKKINYKEYIYLIACLLESVSKVSNVAWIYWAFLKIWDSRAIKKMKFIKLETENDIFNVEENKVFNKDLKELIKEIEGDILYLDPPYTISQYSSQYHILETIAKNDEPNIKWITWNRDDNFKSNWSKKWKAKEELEYIIWNANFKHIILSYSSKWIIEKEYIENIFKKYWKEWTYSFCEIPYKQYLNKRTEKGNNFEYVFYIEK